MREKSRDELSPSEIRAALYNFLSYRPRTRREALTKFRSIGGPDEEADKYMEEFEELGLIDDQKFALDFADVRLRSKKHGRIRIRRDLLKKGIASKWIDDAILECVNEELEVEAAKKSIPLKWQRKKKPLNWDDLQKIRSALRRRGFEFDVIKKALLFLDEE